MTFTIEDYEKAIARIFLFKEDGTEHVIGTGFLIAPGYVLTCAHVVLQANHVDKENFTKDNYKKQPEMEISLDFPVLVSGQKINAKVVEWLPYNLEKGDVAVVKLLTPEPKGIKPISLFQVSLDEIKEEQHSVYGFGKNIGSQSDAYRPKTIAAGGRFQLFKYGNPNDETIQPGFSGAPVWNVSRQRVIGMVATANVAQEGQQNTAYAIPTKELQTILKQVDTLSLLDILTQSLSACSDDNTLPPLQIAINTALQHCSSKGGDWQQQLEDLSHHPSPIGWGEGKLVYFVMILYQIRETPKQVLEQLEAWVERCGYKFSDLFVRIDKEMRQKKISRSNQCKYLMVTVEQVETSTDKLRVSLWAIPNLTTYKPGNPPMPLVSETVLSRQELPAFVLQEIRQKLKRKPIPTIHLFLPRIFFGDNFEMLPIGRVGNVLGGEYPFVVRTNLRTHPIGQYYYDDWHEKWKKLKKALKNNTCNEVKHIDCSQPDNYLISKIKDTYAAWLEKCDSVDKLFDLISSEAMVLPVALWSRNPQLQDQLTNVLDGYVKDLPERVLQERSIAVNDNTRLGHHLSLVWEDPKIVPPDMQFDSEMF